MVWCSTSTDKFAMHHPNHPSWYTNSCHSNPTMNNLPHLFCEATMAWRGMFHDSVYRFPSPDFPLGSSPITYIICIYIVYMCVWNMPPVIHTYSSTTPRNTPRYFRCLGAAPGSFSGAIPWGMAWNWCETGDKSSTSFGPDCADDISASSNNMMNI